MPDKRSLPLLSHNFIHCGCFPLAKNLVVVSHFHFWAFCRSFLRCFRAFFVLFWSVCGGDLAVFLLAFRGVYDWNWNNEVSRKATA